MSDEEWNDWPLAPSHAAAVAHELCMTLADLVHEEASVDSSRRTYLKLCGVATAAEVFARETARFFGNQKGADEDVLEALEARYRQARKA